MALPVSQVYLTVSCYSMTFVGVDEELVNPMDKQIFAISTANRGYLVNNDLADGQHWQVVLE